MIKLLLLTFIIFIGFSSCNKDEIRKNENGKNRDEVKMNKNLDKKDEITPSKPKLHENINYKPMWDKVDESMKKNLPKSALKEVMDIYAKAKNNGDTQEIIKALFYQMKYIQEVEEDTFVKIQKIINDEIVAAPFPANQLLHSILAQMYWQYYQNNRWKYQRRSKTAKFKQEDMRTWDLTKIIEEVEKHYAESIKNPEALKKESLEQFQAILHNDVTTRKLRPTLYDFLTHRAIDFYIQHEAGISKPAYYFTMNDEKYFSENSKFVKIKIESKDETSFDYKAIKLLQELTNQYIDSKNKEALIDITLKRLLFVYNNGIVINSKIHYENALNKLSEQYKGMNIVAEVKYKLARLYYDLGESFKPIVVEKYKDYKNIAKKICEETVKEYPNAPATYSCINLIEMIKKPLLTMRFQEVYLPNTSFKGFISYRNVKDLNVKIIKIKHDLTRNQYLNNKQIKKFLNYKITKEKTFNLPNDKDHQTHSVELNFDSLEPGKYVIIAQNSKKDTISAEYIFVSNISYLFRDFPKYKEFHIKDRLNGKPMKGVILQLYKEKYNNHNYKYEYKKYKKYKSDKNGYIKIDNNIFSSSIKIVLTIGKDIFSPNQTLYRGYRSHERISQEFVSIFTDRKIYRPGQTLYFKAIAIENFFKDGEKSKILPNHSYKITLYDKNYQVVKTKNFKTNQFGTFSGEFNLPQDRLNGQWHLQVNNNNVYFSVEEYKRPKFEVKFKDVEGSYKLNEKIEVTGFAKAYAGFNIDGAKVSYRITRETYYPYRWYWWYYYPTASPVELKHGEVTTNENGEFKVNFKAIPDLSIDKKYSPAFRYVVHADVTDINGETHTSSKTISVGYNSLILNLNLKQSLDRQQKTEKIKLSVTNLSGKDIPTKGKLEVIKLKSPNKIYRNRLWQKTDKFLLTRKEHDKLFPNDIYSDEDRVETWKHEKTVLNYNFDTSKKDDKNLNLKLNKLTTGKYLVKATIKDENNKEIKDIKYITVFDSKSRKTPFKTLFWFKSIKSTVDVGKRAEFLLASSKKMEILYEIEHRGKIIKKNIIKLNNEQKKISIPILEKYRGNISVRFISIKDNRVFNNSLTITVPWSNKELKITFETFRNKLLPGEKDEWRLKITGSKKDKVAAEMLATLYDASLDAFSVNSWYLNVFPSLYARHNFSISHFGLGYATKIKNNSLYLYNFNKSYDRLNWFGFYWRDHVRRRYYGEKSFKRSRGIRKKSKVMVDKAMPAPEGSKMDAEMESKKEIAYYDESDSDTIKDNSVVTAQGGAPAGGKSKNGKKKEKKMDLSQVKARTNFNETAFFYPHLQTNKDGDIIIKFTAPESLTRWKMLGFAHTKDLKYGFTTNELVTQKELMVIPNAPRFLRENDKMIFSTKITNISDKNLNGEVKLILLDAITMKDISKSFKLKNSQKAFKIKKGLSTLVEWNIEVPEEFDAVTYRIVAKAGNFSDGEEKPLPILKNRMLVTETLPLPVRSKETKEFKFKKLLDNKSTTLRHHKLTLEFTSNPAWYAIQALPYLIEYPYECMEQTFSRYYANSIASFVVNSSPKIKRVFDQWKKSDSKELISNLEKNQELKALLLEETPWVMDGQNETERKKRVALLFDLNRMSRELKSAIKKLKNGQHPSGGWPWFKGGYENRWITQHIVSGFAHLHRIGVVDIKKDETLWVMLDKAIKYLDRELEKDYQRLLKIPNINMKDDHVGYMQLHYLYARSYFPEVKYNGKAFDYYLGQSKTYWGNKSKYFQAMIALFVDKYKDTKLAKTILASIKEHFISSEEMGLYFKESYGYYWYNAPIETHAIMIEAYTDILKDTKTVDGLKTWLLKSKQTQNWKTTKATVDAVYALLLQGTNWLNESKLAKITVGRKVIDPKTMDNVKVEAGTGYFKTSWSKSEIKPEMGNIKVENRNDVVAWGAMYWQYFEQLDKITSAETPLKLKKELFVEHKTDTGLVITPITKEKLKIGDRVKVRIELRVDRDMEYVHMKDMRASAFEPENVISRYKWQDGLGYYQSTKDASTNFFFDYLRKGTYVFEYNLRVTHFGDFSNGITTIQSMYAPEFSSHSEGVRVKIKK